MKLILRGHHLLCLKGFQGYGYDENFVKNMTKVNSLRKLPSTTVRLVSEPDDICRECPNLKNGLCQNETENERIISMDLGVLKKFDTNKEYNSIELFEEADRHFSSTKSVKEICFNCMWHEKCLFYQNLENNR